MKKFICLFLSVLFCVLLGVPAFAAEVAVEPVDSAVEECERELYIPDGEPQFSIIPESNDPSAEDMTLNQDETDISPRIIPSTANEFHIVKCEVQPAILKDGKYQAADAKMTFTPKSFAPTTIRETISKADQQAMIDYAESTGETVVGWYITGTFFMDCYMKYWVEYKTFSRDENGETVKAKTVNKGNGIAQFGNSFLFPYDMTKSYTYGYEGKAVMQVYNASANTAYYLYPEYVMKVTFQNN